MHGRGPLPFRPADPPVLHPSAHPDDQHAARAAWRTAAGHVEDDAAGKTADEGPSTHPVRPVPVGDRGPPDNEGHSRRTGTGRSTPPATRSAWPPNLAEARSHRLAGRLHDAPGAGGDAAEVLAEVRRRLDVTPGRAALVREAVADALTGRRPL